MPHGVAKRKPKWMCLSEVFHFTNSGKDLPNLQTQPCQSLLPRIYVCIFGSAGSSLLHVGFLQLQQEAAVCCSAQDSHCSGFSCFGAQVLEHGLYQQLQLAGSVVASGIFLDQGSNLCPLHWQADSRPLEHQISLIQYLRQSKLLSPQLVGLEQNNLEPQSPCL